MLMRSINLTCYMRLGTISERQDQGFLIIRSSAFALHSKAVLSSLIGCISCSGPTSRIVRKVVP